MNIVCGQAKCGKTEYIYSRLKQGIENGQKQMLIVPETTSHQAEKAFLKICGNKAALTGQVSTFTKLCTRIIDNARLKTPIVSDGGRILMMHKAIEKVQSSLEYYVNIASKPQLVTKLLSMSDELKACAVTAEQMLEASLSADMPPKIGDIGKIYAAYCAICGQFGLDGKDKITIAAENLCQSGIFDNTDVYIDGFFGFTKQEYDFIFNIQKCAKSVSITLLLGDDKQLYMEQYKTLGRLKRLASAGNAPCEIIKPQAVFNRPSEIDYLCENIFNYSAPVYEKNCKAIKLYAAANSQQECELAAGIIRNAVLDTEVRYREICLVCGDETQYTDKLKSTFAAYDIPFFVSKKQDILKKPPMVAALEPFKAIYYGMSIDSVMAYLKTGLCGIDTESREMLENYAFTWNINGKKWFETWTLPVEGYKRTVENDPKLVEINNIRAAVMEPLLQLKNDLRDCHCGGDFAKAFRRHLERCSLESRLENRISHLETIGNLRVAAEYGQLFQIITEAAEQFELICAQDKMDVNVFLQLFTLMLSQYDVGSIPVMLDSVIVGDFDRVTPERIKILIVLGARDGLLPPIPAQASVLSEGERIALECAGIELTQSQEERAFEGYSKIVQTFSAPSQAIIFTRPKTGEDGGEYTDSYLLKRICKMFPSLHEEEAQSIAEQLALTAKEPAFEMACIGSGVKNSSPVCSAAHNYFDEDAVKHEYFTALNTYASSPRGPIKKLEVVKGIYGEKINLSASKVERVSTCRFSYFMQYGLKVKARKKAAFGAPEVGSLVHFVAENAIRDLDEDRALSIETTAKKYIALYIETKLGGFDNKTARFKGLLRNMSKYVINIVTNIYAELKCSDFRPLCFEMSFGQGGEVPAMTKQYGSITLSYNGKIDRVDGYVQGDRLYIKVVDYKTGSKSFKLSDVYNGLNMQMFLYMLMLRESGTGYLTKLAHEKLGADIHEQEMAGALYIPAKSPFISAGIHDSDEDIKEKTDNELRRIGLVNSDPVVLGALEHVQDGAYRFLPIELKKDGTFKVSSQVATAAQMGRLIKKVECNLNLLADAICTGDIEANPLKADKNKSVCQWCDYKSACHFDESMERDAYREVAAKSDIEVHKILEKEAEVL